METTQSSRLPIAKNDHDMLKHYLRTNNMELKYDQAKAQEFMEDIRDAEVINPSEFPSDKVRLNSKVTVRNTLARQNYTYTVVLPDKADQKHEMISILAPMGMALFGAKKGDTISLDSSKGRRHFTIQEVTNPVD
ncbi:MAG TPA: GreA/GreB family elongation factor [Chitinophagaceae bacterium]|nr:GreA/GreB family elongation factor [Chitinophagaceae bacterium]